MFARIHEKLGTAGFIIAIVALVVAMSGGAYAAKKGFTGKQKKEVQKIAKKAAKKAAKKFAKAGPQGPAGPAGVKGATGAKGDAGAHGAPGAAGINGVDGAPGAPGTAGPEGAEGPEGSPWTAGGVLPEGATETGAFAGFGLGPGLVKLSASFTIPLETAEGVTGVFVKTGEDGSAQGCPGLRANGTPEADPGTFCAYQGATNNAIGLALVFDPTRSFIVSENEVSPAGAGLLIQSTASSEPLGQWEVAGVWALTAPEE